MDALPLSLDSEHLSTENEATPAEPVVLDTPFASLYENNLPGIYSYIRARVGSDEDATDLAHHVFTQALEALPRFRDRGVPPRAWLYRIARNTVIDFHRRTRSSVAWEAVPESQQPRHDLEIESAVLAQERAERLHQVLRGLDEEKVEVLALRFAAGLKIREIAAVLDRSESAIKTELRRTLRLLRERYDDD